MAVDVYSHTITSLLDNTDIVIDSVNTWQRKTFAVVEEVAYLII